MESSYAPSESDLSSGCSVTASRFSYTPSWALYEDSLLLGSPASTRDAGSEVGARFHMDTASLGAASRFQYPHERPRSAAGSVSSRDTWLSGGGAHCRPRPSSASSGLRTRRPPSSSTSSFRPQSARSASVVRSFAPTEGFVQACTRGPSPWGGEVAGSDWEVDSTSTAPAGQAVRDPHLVGEVERAQPWNNLQSSYQVAQLLSGHSGPPPRLLAARPGVSSEGWGVAAALRGDGFAAVPQPANRLRPPSKPRPPRQARPRPNVRRARRSGSASRGAGLDEQFPMSVIPPAWFPESSVRV